MKPLIYALVLVVCVVTLDIDLGYALRCFGCQSTTGYRNNCEVKANVNTTHILQCQSGYTTCMTLKMRTNITRSCAVRDVCHRYRNATGFRSCSTCYTDLCNGTGRGTASSTGAALGLIISALAVVGKIAITR
ncbi:hypothetical protein NQ315_000437 [Exocentrus adspersus]|uniref:Protein sleepless n=1 Tax=Exocentrus adspersus TaxID=1586481 RepID=A0AAV8VLU5_9CUCU|nr:hypothetical protein NQ315_000437 [Exocentrus adspersus]